MEKVTLVGDAMVSYGLCETWQAGNIRTNAVVIQCKERRFVPGLEARVSVPNIS
jgi:hypothetical protein